MHYRNGRQAKQGDRVINTETGCTGMVYDLRAGVQTCNGRLAETSHTDGYVNLSDCLHLDDVKAAFPRPDA